MRTNLQRGKLSRAIIALLAITCLSLATTATRGQAGDDTPPISQRIIAPVIVQFPSGTGWATEPPEARSWFVPLKIPIGTAHDGTTLSGDAWRLVKADHPQVVVLLLGDRVVLDRFVIPAAGPDPGPTPDPPPIVDPPDPVPVTEVVIVRETKATDPELAAKQAAVILSTEWRQVLDDAKIPWKCLDQDQLPERLQPLAERAAGKAVVFFVGSAGVDTAVMVLVPDSIEGLTALVEEKVKP